MHAEIMDFLEDAKRRAGLDAVAGMVVVELGSYDLNGSPRPLFAGAQKYVGIDWREGPGVDVVSLVHKAWWVESADVVICCQMLEHDPHWILTVLKACSMIRKNGGWFFCTWAGPGYVEHELETAPPDPDSELPYYRNLSIGDVKEVVAMALDDATIHTGYKRGTLDALMWVKVDRKQE